MSSQIKQIELSKVAAGFSLILRLEGGGDHGSV